jgi:hypothetical protein
LAKAEPKVASIPFSARSTGRLGVSSSMLSCRSSSRPGSDLVARNYCYLTDETRGVMGQVDLEHPVQVLDAKVVPRPSLGAG